LFLQQFPPGEAKVEKKLFLNSEKITQYVCRHDNYFMLGDNRDNSADSRYWGFVNRNFVKAKAFITYFSLDEKVPAYLLPIKIRWNRLGKLIRNFDGE
jgi:signal peptidase I